MGQKFSWLLYYSAYVSSFSWWLHWFLFKILAITVLTATAEPIIISKSIPTRLKAIELFFQNIKKLWDHLLKCIFPLIFKLLIPRKWLTPRFVVFWEIYILVTHWWPVSIPKSLNEDKLSWMMPHDILFLKLMKTWWRQQKYLMKGGQIHNIWKQQVLSRPTAVGLKCLQCYSKFSQPEA